MLRAKIIEVTVDTMIRYGIKECRMDAISSSVRVSKKTVYDLFGSKQNLLREAVFHLIGLYKAQFEGVSEGGGSPLLAIVELNNVSLEQALNCSPSFYSDIAGNADLSELFRVEYILVMQSCYHRLFVDAKERGLLLCDINISDTLDFFEQQIRIMCEKKSLDAMRKMDNYTFVILTHLSGICTDKGREELLAVSAKNAPSK